MFDVEPRGGRCDDGYQVEPGPWKTEDGFRA